MTMDSIEIKLKELKGEKNIILDNIKFTNCVYLQILINGSDIRNWVGFEDMLVVYDELYKSSMNSGQFLIFTCACGVADDGGWNFVKVIHTEEYIEWYFFREESYNFKFLKNQYVETIAQIKHMSEKIIPKEIIFPE